MLAAWSPLSNRNPGTCRRPAEVGAGRGAKGDWLEQWPSGYRGSDRRATVASIRRVVCPALPPRLPLESPPPETTDRLNDLVQQCVDQWPQTGGQIVEDLCLANPDLATALRRRMAVLQRTGFLSEELAPRSLGEFDLVEHGLAHPGLTGSHIQTPPQFAAQPFQSLSQMSITGPVTITGQSSAHTFINANNASRIFSIQCHPCLLRGE